MEAPDVASPTGPRTGPGTGSGTAEHNGSAEPVSPLGPLAVPAATAEGLSSHHQMLALTMSRPLLESIGVITRLGIPDVLADGEPQPVDDIAASVGAHGPTLYRVLRLLTEIDVVTELPGRRFTLTPLGATLRRDVPGSLASLALWRTTPTYRAAAAGLHDSVVTGEPAFPKVHGMGLFEHLERHPDEAAIFNAGMTEGSAGSVIALLPRYDFTPFRTVVDVGGGHGRLLGTLLAGHPSMRGVLFDQPDVVAGAESHLTSLGVQERCDVVGGDFFEAVPAGGDLYVLANVLHDWTDERASQILRNCRAAMTPGSRLLIAEWVMGDAPNRDLLGKLIDITMLFMTDDGRERTRGEFEQLLAGAGLELTRVIRADVAQPSLVEAVPASD